MLIFIGLGNPGEKYKNNRHNVGFILINYLISHLDIQGVSVKTFEKFDSEISEVVINNKKCLFVKPQSFMNNSGIVVKKILDFFKKPIENLTVIHDDLDIPLGKFKIQNASGPKLHNGILSIEQHLKTDNFKRIRIGIDSRNPQNNIDGETYVLSDFTKEEFIKLQEVLKKVERLVV
jgi:PTH1 family peptidyl-tRNA hydrolase